MGSIRFGLQRRFWLRFTLIVFCFGVGFGEVQGQSQEVKQLMLNVEKLSQLKNILQDMKRGYSIVSDGYRQVKNIAEGNFSLHEVFLDGLMVVSPEVKKYRRVADIISAQKAIVSEYRKSFKRLASANVLASGELEYISRVYAGLFEGSMDNLDELAMVITSSRLRMDDQQRLEAIDRVFLEVSGKLEFLRAFNRDASVLLALRKREAAGVKSVQDLFGN